MAKARKEEEEGEADRKLTYNSASPEDLLLDAKNPRLVEFAHTSNPTQFELLRTLWQKMAVDELAMSIAANGFFPHEPLFVIEDDGKHIVIEGNRRLAALKLLRDPVLRKRLRITDLPALSEKKQKELDKIPTVITTRKDLWQYVGFKHVNGPAKWGSYAKAQYIAFVKENYKVPLDQIAEQIGDKNRTVQRLYRAMMVIQQAEAADVFHRENRYKGSFAFSHLYTGLDYDGFKRFLKLRDATADSKEPVPKDRINELGELCKWLYGDKRGDTMKPVIQSQNPDLATLDEILMKDESIDALRSGMTLALAHDVSLGEDRIFRESLQQAKHHLSRASGTLTIGFKKEDTDLLRTAESIADMADDLVAQMERKSRPEKKRRRSGEADDV
jgi:hypothetical protein